MALPRSILGFIILFSIINLPIAKSTSNNDDIDVATLCMGNSTTSNSTFQRYNNNVATLLAELPHQSNPQFEGFSNISAGEAPNKAYGSYFCRGDINTKRCRKCVAKATESLSKQDYYEECFSFGEYKASDICIIHYAAHSVAVYQEGYVMSLGRSGGKVPNYQQYNQILSTTVEGLVQEAGYGNWSRTNFATKVVDVSGSDHENIYILVHCIPVLSPMNCSRCLGELYGSIPGCCNGTYGGLVIHADCMMMYNNTSFFGASRRSFVISFFHVCMVILLSIYFLTCF